MAAFPFFKQHDAMDCGPSCLRMIAKHYGRSISLQKIRELSHISREGVSLLGISEAAEELGFHSIGTRINFDQLSKEAPLPCIAHWRQNHFVVVYKIKKDTVYVADPAHTLIKYTKAEFIKNWASIEKDGVKQGICLLIEPTPSFSADTYLDDDKTGKTGFRFLFSYLGHYRKFIVQLLIGMIFGSLIQLIFPFLTQSIVDFGINNNDISFINLVLIAQLVLLISRMSVDMIRSWILLHIGTRVNISLISDFLIKMMKLPISFFDTKMIGDIIQRIGDHKRIESFLTSSTLNILFSLVNLIIFGIVLVIYDLSVFLVFFFGSILYVAWILIFLRKRRELDSKRFTHQARNQSSIIQLINGMQEIKLNNCEKQKRWEWEAIQASLYKVRMKVLSLRQYQNAGGVFINETKNIIITFIAAKAVIDGSITLGMMLAIQYIIGQLNSPINQMLEFIHSTQDAKISLERLGEIHNREDEEPVSQGKVNIFPENKSFSIRKLSFQYEGPHSKFVLDDISMQIPQGKVTAIVGVSGSGKTTLIKLLLGFYPPTKGELKIGDISLSNFSQKMLRQKCGVVMQDGFIFSDTIAQNVAVGYETIDQKRLLEAVKLANIQAFIESLPLGYNTKIGADGHGLSQGQKQRILIARAIYKDPEFLFFDEATNALDANNERVIMQNLDRFFKGRTVVVVAHRLSTVKNADQIIVLDDGKIIETGNHANLTAKKGAYYELVKNQLELGN
ncbi:MAG: peptidase domain-containing ABC transporter [Bacteroidales bacterium]|nr:peptidase domain-containing ABC transporter [Bacteroidales bacterium]MCF8456626.1 peptidase domain-containing ABC transporter [Bacteroidales bacterium]